MPKIQTPLSKRAFKMQPNNSAHGHDNNLCDIHVIYPPDADIVESD